MRDFDEIAPTDEVVATDTLSMIALLRKRSRNLRQRVWLLPAALGVTMLLATSLLSTSSVITSCWMTVFGTPKHFRCTVGHSGTALNLVTPTGNLANGQVAGWLTGRPQFAWSVGNTPWFWVIGILASVSLAIISQHSAGRSRKFTITCLFAGLIGILALLTSAKLGLPPQMSHLLAVSVIVCIVGVAADNESFALIAALSFFVGIAVSRQAIVPIPQLGVSVPMHSAAYLGAGLTLISGSMVLFWRIRVRSIPFWEENPN